MGLTFQVTSYEVIPANVYNATLTGIEQRTNENSTFESGNDSYLQWTFEVKGKNKTVELRANSSLSFGTKSKAFGWACALLGRQLQAKEMVDTDDLIGKQCKITVQLENKDGMERNRITDLLPITTPDGSEPF